MSTFVTSSSAFGLCMATQNSLPFWFLLLSVHYLDADQTIRLYHDMHTGKWWWETQVSAFS